VPNAGHRLLEEQPQATVAIILIFFNSNNGPASIVRKKRLAAMRAVSTSCSGLSTSLASLLHQLKICIYT